jgi:hypothetical protein
MKAEAQRTIVTAAATRGRVMFVLARVSSASEDVLTTRIVLGAKR